VAVPPSGVSRTTRSSPARTTRYRRTASRCHRDRAVEAQRRFGRRKVVRTDLYRPVTGVTTVSSTVSPSTGWLLGSRYSPGTTPSARSLDRRCTVTSLVPSGKVASTCTEVDHLGHPSKSRRRWSAVLAGRHQFHDRAAVHGPPSTYELITATASE